VCWPDYLFSPKCPNIQNDFFEQILTGYAFLKMKKVNRNSSCKITRPDTSQIRGNKSDCLHAPGHCLGDLEMLQ
jgi:hypothetical protein